MSSDLLQKFFVEPILAQEGYNWLNTIVYGAILLIVAFVVVYPFFNKRKIKFDLEFFKSVFPYILFGSALRVIEDLGIFTVSSNPLEIGFYFITPGIYIFVGLLAIFSLIVSIVLQQKFKFPALKTFRLIGMIFAVPATVLVLSHFNNPLGLVLIFASILISFFAGWLLFSKFAKTLNFPKLFETPMHSVAFLAQLTDGSATFVAIQFFNYSEQHVVSNALIQFLGPISFLLAKFALGLVIMYAINSNLTKKNESNLVGFILVFIGIIGFAPGLRDALRLIASS